MGVPFLGFWYWSTNQYIIQRALGAKDLNEARWGLILAGFLKIIPLFIMVIPGAIALTVYPDIPNGDAVFPFLVTNVLPVGLVGLVLEMWKTVAQAAMVAAEGTARLERGR